MTSSQPWLVATDIRGAGGIASVLRVYRDAGFLARWNVKLLSSHRKGSGLAKIVLFMRAFACFAWAGWRNRVCLLHVHSASHGSFWRKSCFILAAHLMRIPVLFHLHGGGFRAFYESESGPLGRKFIRHVLRRVDGVVVLAEAWRDFAIRLAPNARVDVLPNPVSVPPARPRPRGDPVVLFLGLVNERKGVFDLVAAMPAVLARHPRCRFVVAGTGEVEALRAAASSLAVSAALETPGWVEGEDKETLLGQASVFVLPSYFEAMPMSLLEAMARGIPCVASRVGGIPDMIEEGVEGVLLPPGDTQALSQGLNRLLDDMEASSRLGDCARDRVVRQFSAEVGLRRLDELYARHCTLNLP